MIELKYGGESFQIKKDGHLETVMDSLKSGKFPGFVQLTTRTSAIWVNLSEPVPFVFKESSAKVA